MLKAIIIEDEIGSVSVILNLLASNNIVPIQVMGVADTVQSGKEMIIAQKPDIVFMDIELKDGSSFHILEKLPIINFKLVFVTAFDKFALEAFRFSAIDYLLKPIDNEAFFNVIRKIADKEPPTTSEKQLQFLKEIRNNNVLEKINKLALIEHKEIVFESLENIIAFKAQESYTEIQTKSKKYMMSKNLGHYQELLVGHDNFVRIHYSTIINIDFVQKISQNESNRQFKVELINGMVFEVSHRRVSEFRKMINL